MQNISILSRSITFLWYTSQNIIFLITLKLFKKPPHKNHPNANYADICVYKNIDLRLVPTAWLPAASAIINAKQSCTHTHTPEYTHMHMLVHVRCTSFLLLSPCIFCNSATSSQTFISSARTVSSSRFFGSTSVAHTCTCEYTWISFLHPLLLLLAPRLAAAGCVANTYHRLLPRRCNSRITVCSF